jgi:hypothetical protein
MDLRSFRWVCLFVWVCTGGCGGNGGAPVGSEGGLCYGNGSCDEPLVCLSNLCVRAVTTTDGGPGSAGQVAGPDGGGGPGSPVDDATVDATGGDCDVLGQTGCAAYEGCVVTLPIDGTTQCMTAGTGEPGEPCAAFSSCAQGSFCLLGRCVEYCDTTASIDGCVAPLGFPEGVGVRLPTCDPLEQDCSWDDFSCQLPGGSSNALCIPTGEAGEGQGCSTVNCAEGLSCEHSTGERLCRVHCQLGTAEPCAGADADTCVPVESVVDRSLPDVRDDFGYCMPSE